MFTGKYGQIVNTNKYLLLKLNFNIDNNINNEPSYTWDSLKKLEYINNLRVINLLW